MRFGRTIGQIKSIVKFLSEQSFKLNLRWKGLITGLSVFILSALLGMGLAHAANSPYGMVDPIDARYEAGYSVYVEQCATCHVALPAAVLPIESWQTIVLDPAHYGASLELTQFDQQLILNYLQTYSRRNTSRDTEPYRLRDSNYFQALHPKVELPTPLNLRSCASCHINANEQDYTLSQ